MTKKCVRLKLFFDYFAKLGTSENSSEITVGSGMTESETERTEKSVTK